MLSQHNCIDLNGARSTYNNVDQLCNVPVGERLEDLDFALKILKELGVDVESVAFDGLDSNLLASVLCAVAVC